MAKKSYPISAFIHTTNLTIEKEVERVVFIRGHYKG